MTTIQYRINNQTGRDLTADDWETAKALQEKTQAEEIAQFKFWSATAEVTNNDGSITQCPIDDNGVPIMYDLEADAMVPYVDTTSI
jgi:hypothetical protein